MRKVFDLDGLDCANCAAKIEAAIQALPGVKNASVTFMTQKLVLETEENMDDVLAEVKKLVAKIEPDCEIMD